jgi:hypothetical protein
MARGRKRKPSPAEIPAIHGREDEPAAEPAAAPIELAPVALPLPAIAPATHTAARPSATLPPYRPGITLRATSNGKSVDYAVQRLSRPRPGFQVYAVSDPHGRGVLNGLAQSGDAAIRQFVAKYPAGSVKIL